MGDRSTVTIVIRREHMDAFMSATKIDFGDPDEIDDPIFEPSAYQLPVQAVMLWYYDVNYGGVRVLEEVAESTGLTFVGSPGSGQQYPA